MTETNKKNLNLSVEEDLIKKARDQKINISEITEKFLRAFTASSVNVDKEKMYKAYQELFNLMSPLLQKFKTTTVIARDQIFDTMEIVGEDEDGNPIEGDPIFSGSFDIRLHPNRKL